jgi:hypothetical protein
MKPIRLGLGLLAISGLLYSSVQAGAEFLLYPFARAFGSPSEVELVKCRAAFAKLQTDFATSHVLVQPVLVRPGAASLETKGAWNVDLAGGLVGAIRAAGGAGFCPRLEVHAALASVGATPFGHNQLRYLWARGAEYGRCLRTARSAGDYFLFVEIFGRENGVGAVQVYVLDASGQLAYCRLFNSHHFGKNLSRADDGALRLIAQNLLRDLRQSPEVIFPPYGVG